MSSNRLWEAIYNDRYEVAVTATDSYHAILEVREEGKLVFSQEVELREEPRYGVDEDDVQDWRDIVEDFADEQKFGFN